MIKLFKKILARSKIYLDNLAKQLFSRFYKVATRIFQPLVLFFRPFAPVFRVVFRFYSKGASYFLLFEMYFAYFTGKTWLGMGIYLYTLFVGCVYVSDPMTRSEIFCFVYASNAIGNVLSLYALFRIPGFEKWCFKELGEERVKKLLYNSPPVTTLMSRVTTAGLAIIAGTTLIDGGERIVQQSQSAHIYISKTTVLQANYDMNVEGAAERCKRVLSSTSDFYLRKQAIDQFNSEVKLFQHERKVGFEAAIKKEAQPFETAIGNFASSTKPESWILGIGSVLENTGKAILGKK